VRVDRDLAGGHQQRVPIGRRLRDSLRADHGIGAGPVVDDHGLPHQPAHVLAEQPRCDVVAAAGGEGNDDLDILIRVRILRRARAGQSASGNHHRAHVPHYFLQSLHWFSPCEVLKPRYNRDLKL
jgi:hypothetical protein